MKEISTQIVCHTSGITRRESELSTFFPEIDVRSVDDFSQLASFDRRSKWYPDNSLEIKRMIVELSIRLGYFSRCNTDLEFWGTSRRVMQIRGHYSYRNLSKPCLEEINEGLKSSGHSLISPLTNHNTKLTLHYRLGDLLTLESKSFVSPARILKAIHSTRMAKTLDEILIYSDSPLEAIQLIRSVDQTTLNFIPKTGNAMEVISNMQIGDFFIGTNSKLSLWALIYRLHFGINKISWMPKELQENIILIIKSKALLSYVNFY